MRNVGIALVVLSAATASSTVTAQGGDSPSALAPAAAPQPQGCTTAADCTSDFLAQLLSPPVPLRDTSTSGHAMAAASSRLSFHAGHAGNAQVRAVMPMSSVFATRTPSETITAAIYSHEVTQHLEQHSETVSALAKVLGWQNTGLLPTVEDLQKMASGHISMVSDNIEYWALRNVSLSASSQAMTHSDSQAAMLEWQWSLTNNNHHMTNYGADTEASFSANLLRLFGMSDYPR